MNYISLIVSILIVIYLPMAIYGIMRVSIFVISRKKKNFITHPNYFKLFFSSSEPRDRGIIQHNNVIIEIATSGKNLDSIKSIINRISGYGKKVPVFVLTEYDDETVYTAQVIKVPKEYETPKKSKKKMRAMQYGIEELHRLGYGAETYIIHLDDDAYVNEDYIDYVANYMTAVGGQGSIRLRDYVGNNLTGLLDTTRVSACLIQCTYNNIKNRPKFVHGEGLVVRADIEYDMGWDYGLAGPDDLIMGLAISQKYWVDHIPCNIYINPPTTMKEFFVQRRRWATQIFGARKIEAQLNSYIFLFYIILYFYSIAGIVAEILWLYVIAAGISINPVIFIFSIINLISIFINYEIGALYTNKKYAIIMPFVFLFLGLIENATTIYSILRKQDINEFPVIYKRPVSGKP